MRWNQILNEIPIQFCTSQLPWIRFRPISTWTLWACSLAHSDRSTDILVVNVEIVHFDICLFKSLGFLVNSACILRSIGTVSSSTSHRDLVGHPRWNHTDTACVGRRPDQAMDLLLGWRRGRSPFHDAPLPICDWNFRKKRANSIRAIKTGKTKLKSSKGFVYNVDDAEALMGRTRLYSFFFQLKNGARPQ